MAVMNGYEATQWIKQQPQGAETIIIALTASAFEEDRNMILASGCDDYLRKPFQEETIWQAMAQHLGVRYIYEPDPDPNLDKVEVFPHTVSNSAEGLNPRALKVMPLAWIEQLHLLAVQLNKKQVLELLEEIPESHQDLAQNLAKLASGYQFDQIVQLTQTSKE